VLATLLVLTACGSTVTGTGSKGSTTSAPVPVVFVHGATAGLCPGLDVKKWSAGIATAMTNAGWPASLLDSVGFDRCDTDYSERISSALLVTPLSSIAHDLAWYVYNHYTARGQTVDLVGHSMGGMLIRYAMTRIAADDPAYPSRVLVRDVVTFSSPYRGVTTTAICAVRTAVACTDLQAGSMFVSRLTDAVPAGQRWVVFGSSACDFIPAADSTIAPGATGVVYGRPCYSHTAYLTDTSIDRDAVGPSDHRHSLAAMMSVFATGTA
jgi:triacylglycerol esterase/lipase EstA (alpha/beta hydrolase family)